MSTGRGRKLSNAQECRMSFLCGDLIVLLSDDVEAVCKNLQADHRVRLVQSEEPEPFLAS